MIATPPQVMDSPVTRLPIGETQNPEPLTCNSDTSRRARHLSGAETDLVFAFLVDFDEGDPA